MEKPVISVFHHKFGVSVAVVHGENPADYWARVDGYEGGDGVEWLESFDLAMPFAAAPEMLTALKMAVEGLDFAQAQTESQSDHKKLMSYWSLVKHAVTKAEGRTA